MKIKEALSYMAFMLENGHWKKTEKSLDCFNTLNDFVGNTNKVNDYKLFAKLYISFYGELLKYYGCTVMDKQPEKAINKILATPIKDLIDKFINKAHDMEYLVQLPKDERYEPRKYKNVKDLEWDFKFVDKMEYQEAEDNLTAMINLTINKYN